MTAVDDQVSVVYRASIDLSTGTHTDEVACQLADELVAAGARDWTVDPADGAVVIELVGFGEDALDALSAAALTVKRAWWATVPESPSTWAACFWPVVAAAPSPSTEAVANLVFRAHALAA